VKRYNLPKRLRQPKWLKRYAELIGNYKRYEIKSSYDNKLDFPDSLAGLITNVLGGSNVGKAKSINANKYLY
jgi:hypothetical protein